MRFRLQSQATVLLRTYLVVTYPIVKPRIKCARLKYWNGYFDEASLTFYKRVKNIVDLADTTRDPIAKRYFKAYFFNTMDWIYKHLVGIRSTGLSYHYTDLC